MAHFLAPFCRSFPFGIVFDGARLWIADYSTGKVRDIAAPDGALLGKRKVVA